MLLKTSASSFYQIRHCIRHKLQGLSGRGVQCDLCGRRPWTILWQSQLVPVSSGNHVSSTRLPELVPARGAHSAPLKQISVKMCQQLWARDRAAEDTARAPCVQIHCWRCLLERRCSTQRALPPKALEPVHSPRTCRWANQSDPGWWVTPSGKNMETKWQEKLKKSSYLFQNVSEK